MIETIRVRDLMAVPFEVAETLIPQNMLHNLVFDDGEVLQGLTPIETRYSRFFWKLFEHYPNTQILSKHHVFRVLNGKQPDTGTHSKLCSRILKSIVMSYNLFYPEQKEHLLELIYETMSDAMCWAIIDTEEDVISIDITDFVQIVYHEDVMRLVEEAKKDKNLIGYTYKETMKIVKTDRRLVNNGLSKATRAAMTKENQVNQCTTFRGIPSEVDGVMFPIPVWCNYTTGFRDLYSLATDERTGAKSHYYSEAALQDSEYNARKIQLHAMVLERIVYEDCHSTKLAPWLVKGKDVDENGVVNYAGDLANMLGKYYKVSLDDTEYQVIDGSEEHLVGKKIWLRTIEGCEHPDPHACCHVCFGELHHNVSRYTNLGHEGGVNVTGPLTGMILSIKHVNTSSVAVKITIGDHEKLYLNTGRAGEAYYINAPKRKNALSVILMKDEVPGLLDLGSRQDAGEGQSLARVSSISKICLMIEKEIHNQVVTEMVPLNVAIKNAKPMLTEEFLGYISEKGWETDANGNFVFSLSEWQFNQPFLVMESKEDSFVDLAKEINSMIESSQKLYKKRIETNAPFILLQDLFSTANRKLNINIVCFEIIIYSLMVKSTTSFALARGSENPVLGISEMLTKYRTLGPAMTFQDHQNFLMEPLYFYGGDRPDHPLDVVLKPQEVILAHYGPQT